MPDTPDHPDSAPPSRTDLARAIARQRAGRRRVGVAAAALAVGLVTAACTTANAATPGGVDRAGSSVSSQGGHSGHGAVGADDTGADDDPAAADDADDAAGANGNEDSGAAGNPADEQQAADEQAGAEDKDADKAKDAAEVKDAAANKDAKKRDNGLDVIGRDCAKSTLSDHTGFQVAPACVDTAFGEVAAADKSPALLITSAPTEVEAGKAFTLKVSTRNLVRDRFLGAAAGGYYLESSFLDESGIQRGHFHTACRMLPSLDEAPDAAPAPEFFVATQDNKGGSGTDTVDVVVTGLPKSGTAQCTSWAGDGSHRIPMMQRANQTPAVDSVRITVK